MAKAVKVTQVLRVLEVSVVLPAAQDLLGSPGPVAHKVGRAILVQQAHKVPPAYKVKVLQAPLALQEVKAI